ncbi:MAG: hypothetical protein QW514_08380 [Thermoprotei archaeon]
MISQLELKAIHVVYANWCPHCMPTTVEAMKKAAQTLGVPIKLYDIDTDAVREADKLVAEHGDWCEDYLIPQVFFEYPDGKIEHVLTGYSEDVKLTAKGVANLLTKLGVQP